ncbi:MAG: FAD-dependent oxidoreductase [Lachnospiraceae bacterium]|nr:FAD-dependent oxidoreductase [Lachnospiraceae bacterium]
MSKRILVVGGVAGGASAAARIRRIDAKAEIIVFERGEHVSFSNCALPYHLSGIVEDSESLVMMSPEKFKKQHDIQVRVRSEVTAINRNEKTITVHDFEKDTVYTESYDKLILSPGANPILPASIPGIRKPHVFSVRNVTDIRALKQYLDANQVKKTAVIGGGFIGVEVAENMRMAGLEVALVEGMPQIMAPFDYDMVQILHKEMLDHGISLHVSATLSEILDHSILVKKKDATIELEADLVVMAIGVRPETTLAREAGLDIGATGGIQVNHNYQTNDPDIYAVGDAVEIYNRLLHRPGRLALAGPAQRQARAAAGHIYGMSHRNTGYIGSSCVKIFEQNAACTGLNEKAIREAGIPYNFAYILPTDKVGLMPDSHYMCFKLLFEVPTGRILGAQAIGKGNVDKRIDVIAAMITSDSTLEDLKELELCYSPVFGTAKDVVNLAAMVASNLLEDHYRQVPVTKVRELVESGACIIDVREEMEYAAGHLKGAKNIPLSQLRERMDEIPRDIPVYLHCRTSQRSYYAICCLQGNGYTNVTNLSGSFLGISLYEYFNDVTEGRTPILTNYNFN